MIDLNRYQSQLFANEILDLNLKDADISYHSNFMQASEAKALYENLTTKIHWRQERITVYGKQHLVPRLSCWMADSGLNYQYSNMTMQPTPWLEDVLLIKTRLTKQTGLDFNSVLINYYRDGNDSNGWHADNEIELGHNPIIASISLGATRDFHLRHNQDKQLKHTIALEHGSLLIMRGSTQTYWQHQIPKRKKAEPRINLTFRSIKS